MFRIVEIVGISKEGFSQAVQDAVGQVTAQGETPAWFEVAEQRGSIKEGQLDQFQVKLKVAVSAGAQQPAAAKAEEKESCPTCHTHSEDGHLCVPVTRKDKKCDWCGSLIANERHLCDDKVKELAYVCNTCGRTAVSEKHLCNPKKIKK